MSSKNFVSYGDMETIVSEINEKINNVDNNAYPRQGITHYYNENNVNKIKITINSTSNWSIDFTINLHQNNESAKIIISGNKTEENRWNEPKAIILGNSIESIPVYFGYNDEDDTLYVALDGSENNDIFISDLTGNNLSINDTRLLFLFTDEEELENIQTTINTVNKAGYIPVNPTNTEGMNIWIET